jgi:hypothetical protein
MDTYLNSLRTDVWRTSGARYNAARRLRRRETIATFSLALFSALSGALPFFQRVYAEAGSSLDNYLTTFSAGLGIFLLTISLIEWGARTGAMAESLHQNAERLNGLHRKIKLEQAVASSTHTAVHPIVATELSQEYEEIKASCSHNHFPADDEYFRAVNRQAEEFADRSGNPRMSLLGRGWASFQWYITSIWYFTVLWVIVLAALWYASFVNGHVNHTEAKFGLPPIHKIPGVAK